MAVASTFSTFAVLLLSSFVGWAIDGGGGHTAVENWKVIFIVTAGVSIVPGMLFIAFGSAKVQTWNCVREDGGGGGDGGVAECDEQSPLCV